MQLDSEVQARQLAMQFIQVESERYLPVAQEVQKVGEVQVTQLLLLQGNATELTLSS